MSQVRKATVEDIPHLPAVLPAVDSKSANLCVRLTELQYTDTTPVLKPSIPPGAVCPAVEQTTVTEYVLTTVHQPPLQATVGVISRQPLVLPAVVMKTAERKAVAVTPRLYT